MSDTNENAAVVRVEVKVPVPTAEARMPLQEAHRVTGLRMVNFDYPKNPALVRDEGMETYICAKGTASHSGGHALRHVVGRVYRSGEIVPNLPDPCGQDRYLRCAVISGSQWEFSHHHNNELPHAVCDPVASNTLAVWAYFEGVGYVRATKSFIGQCSDKTDCQASGDPIDPDPIPEPLGRLRLTGRIIEKTGDFTKLPDQVTLLKEEGKRVWSWSGGTREMRFAVEQEGHGPHVRYWLKGAVFDPPVIPPHPHSKYQPLELVFQVKGRTGVAGAEGSFTIIVTE